MPYAPKKREKTKLSAVLIWLGIRNDPDFSTLEQRDKKS